MLRADSALGSKVRREAMEALLWHQHYPHSFREALRSALFLMGVGNGTWGDALSVNNCMHIRCCACSCSQPHSHVQLRWEEALAPGTGVL